MLHNTHWYLGMEKRDTWSAYQDTVLDSWRDVFMVQAAWRNKELWTRNHMSAVASMNAAALNLYAAAMSARLHDELVRYGGAI